MTIKIINKLRNLWVRRSSESYLNYLRTKGIKIGEGTIALDPLRITIDYSRPSLVEIGSNVFLHRYTKILTHDWASWCFVNLYSDFIPSHGKVKIGNNVWLGESCTIMKGVTIGDNCIIGYGSIVTKSIPSNSVAIGSPAKVVSTLEEYYQKRKAQYTEEVINYAISIKEQLNRSPLLEDFYDDYPIFVDKQNIEYYKTIPFHNIFNKEQYNRWLNNHKAQFNSFEEFLRATEINK